MPAESWPNPSVVAVVAVAFLNIQATGTGQSGDSWRQREPGR